MRWAWFGLVWFDFFLFLDFRFFFFYMQIVISCSSVTDFNLIFWGCLILVTKTVFFFFSQEYIRNSRGVQLFTCRWLPFSSAKALVFLCHGGFLSVISFPSLPFCDVFSLSVNGRMDGWILYGNYNTVHLFCLYFFLVFSRKSIMI